MELSVSRRSKTHDLTRKIFLMEKRIGALLIIIERKDHVQQMNEVLSNLSSLIIGRQGIPLKEKSVSIISLVVEGTTDELSELSGKIGKLKGISVKTVLAKV